MKCRLISLSILTLILTTTAGCSVVRITQTQAGVAVEKKASKTERRETPLSKKDFRLGFGATNDALGIRLEYRPYYNLETREIATYKPSKGGRSLETLIGAASVGVLIWALSDALVETGEVAVDDDGELYNVTEFDWARMSPLQMASVAGVFLDFTIWVYYSTEYEATVREPWKSSGEITGEWQLLRNHPYRVELLNYGFSKDYLSKSGQESIAITEFLSGIKNPSSLMEIDSASLRASTQFDRKRHTETVRLTTKKELQPFWDTALALLGIDMISAGKPRLMPRAEASAQWREGTISAGNTATLNVTVENTGKGELYRLTAITVSRLPTFNNRELKFGKIMPSESKTVPVSFKTNNLMHTQNIPIRIQFAEYNSHIPADLEAKLQVIETPRPKFDYAYRIVDGGTANSVGNGDGIIQPGESVDIQITIHNSGKGEAADVAVRLTPPSSTDVEMYGGSFKNLDAIASGASETATFNVGVKRGASLSRLRLNLSVEENNFGAETRLTETLSLPINQAAAPRVAVVDLVGTITTHSAKVRSGAADNTPVTAKIPRNSQVNISGQLGDWYRVELQARDRKLIGWIHAEQITTKTAPTQQGAELQTPKVIILEVYHNTPPELELVEPEQKQLEVKGATLDLLVVAFSNKGIKSIELTVNNAPPVDIAERGMKTMGQSMSIPVNSVKIEETIPLTYGDNTIRLVVYDRDGQASQPLVIVATRIPERPRQDYALLFATDLYDNWKPLENPINDARTIGKTLESRYGFSVELVRNPTRNQIIDKLSEYVQKKYNSDDQLLVFFAGHGHFDEVPKLGFLIASDSSSAKRDPRMTSAIPHAWLLPTINNIPCAHIFVVIDACFSGTFDQRVAQRGDEADAQYQDDPEAFIKNTFAIKTRLYLTSGGKEYVPDGKPGAHSPFASRVIKVLRDGGGKDGILTFNHIVKHVEKINPQPQSGTFGYNETRSNFLFINVNWKEVYGL